MLSLLAATLHFNHILFNTIYWKYYHFNLEPTKHYLIPHLTLAGAGGWYCLWHQCGKLQPVENCPSQFGLARLQVFIALWLPAHNTAGELWRPANHSGPISEWTKEPRARLKRQRSRAGRGAPREVQSMASRGRGRSAAAWFLVFLLYPFWPLVRGFFAKTLLASSPKKNTQTFGGGLRPLHSPSKSWGPFQKATLSKWWVNTHNLTEGLSVHWMDWCWSWNSNTLATWCEELTHLKRPWCWERLRAGGEGDDRGWDGWMVSPTQWTWVWVNSGSWFKFWEMDREVWRAAVHGVAKSQTWLNDWTELTEQRPCSVGGQVGWMNDCHPRL